MLVGVSCLATSTNLLPLRTAGFFTFKKINIFVINRINVK